MINKKNRGANLDRHRAPLFFLGLLFASSLVLTAFEWKTYSEEKQPAGEVGETRELPDETIFTAVAMKKPLPPQPIQKPVVDVYELVKNDQELDFPELDVPDLEIDKEPKVLAIEQLKEDVVEVVLDGFKVDVMPSFPGGDKARIEYLKHNVTYPAMAKDAGVQGTVWIEFVVGKHGEIEDAKVVRGIGLGCDEEALRVVNQMPRWTPGKQRGIPVKVRYHLPITYVLRN